jgi:hypothetical protein
VSSGGGAVRRRCGRALAAAAVALAAAVAAAAGGASGDGALSLPSTRDRIHVFADQLPDRLSPGHLRFAAARYVGAQKLGAADTRALHALNPRFVALQYRLALGLGYRGTDEACRPRGEWIRVRVGDAWEREWPRRVRDRWLFRHDGSRVLNCWGWYLVDPDDRGWRRYYVAQLRRQLETTDADGAFLDSARVPAAIGRPFRPALPARDPDFRRAWARRLERLLLAVRRALDRPVVANAGSLLRDDEADYSRVDGVMVEPFALDHDGRPLAPPAWRRQLRKVLDLERAGVVVLAQSYPPPHDRGRRMFALASYLLVKGDRAYVNLVERVEVAWYPEYEIDLGPPATPLPPSLDALDQDGLLVRRYVKGLVVVNPGRTTRHYRPGARYRLLLPVGGGPVPADGRLPAGWRLVTTRVRSLALPPHEGAVLLRG